jgi:hypothetical protein
MSDALRAFIDRHCITSPIARITMSEFQRAFVETLPESERPEWPRGRILAALVLDKFPIGIDQKVQHIGGLSLRGRWVEVNGRMGFITQDPNAKQK